jgi:hypothetical protein
MRARLFALALVAIFPGVVPAAPAPQGCGEHFLSGEMPDVSGRAWRGYCCLLN